MNDCIVAFHKLFNVRNSEGKSVSSDRFCDLQEKPRRSPNCTRYKVFEWFVACFSRDALRWVFQ